MKNVIKLLASALAYLLVYPLALSHQLYYLLTKSEKFFHAQSQALSLVPGMSGSYLRRAYYRQTLQACSSDCEIHFGALITHVGAEIGPGVIISHFAEIGLATLEAGVLIGSHTMIVTAKRTHLAEVEGSGEEGASQPYQRVRIGKKTWIGNSAVILANIGEQCVIGAGSVVVKEIPPRSVAVGNPARVIRQI
jgi:acetyltransferase-like isoleucine patch superfamily enzyme